MAGPGAAQGGSGDATDAAADGDSELPAAGDAPKTFIRPTPTSEALRFVDALLLAPGVEQPALGAEWPMLRKLCIDKTLAANDVPDAWLAAAVIHQGEHLVSFDADFKRLLSRAQFTRLTV